MEDKVKLLGYLGVLRQEALSILAATENIMDNVEEASELANAGGPAIDTSLPLALVYDDVDNIEANLKGFKSSLKEFFELVGELNADEDPEYVIIPIPTSDDS